MPIIKKICEKCGNTFRQDDPAQILCDNCLEAIAREADIAQPSRTMPRNLAPDELQANLGVLKEPVTVTASPNGLRKICVTCKKPYTPLSNAQKQCSECKDKKLNKSIQVKTQLIEDVSAAKRAIESMRPDYNSVPCPSCEDSVDIGDGNKLITSLANVLYAAGIATKEQINAAFQLINFDERLI